MKIIEKKFGKQEKFIYICNDEGWNKIVLP